MATLIFRCPSTRLEVQAWIPDYAPREDDVYEALKCPVCSRTHLVNRSTGRTLGDEEGAGVAVGRPS